MLILKKHSLNVYRDVKNLFRVKSRITKAFLTMIRNTRYCYTMKCYLQSELFSLLVNKFILEMFEFRYVKYRIVRSIG